MATQPFTTPSGDRSRTPPRRSLFAAGAAFAVTAAVASPAAATTSPWIMAGPLAVPPATLPTLQSAIAAYFEHRAAANAPGVADEVTEAMCERMDAEADRIAAMPARSIADIGAKAIFYVEILHSQNGQLTDAEDDIAGSLKADLVALIGGRA